MIKGKAKMEFVNGDIRMTACLSGVTGALCCITQKPHEIGESVPVDNTWSSKESEVIMTFTKPESIDALIAELTDIRDIMTGTYDKELMEHDGLLDFDSFMEN